MTLILLAISLTIALCIIAYHLATFALPAMVGLGVFQYMYATDAGVVLSALVALGVALASIALVLFVIGFARNSAFRLVALAVFAIPAAIAGYALVHGVTKTMLDSALALNLLGGVGGLAIGIASIVNLNTLGAAVFSR